MKLVLTRKWFTKNSTIGELTIDGVFYCYILEDVVRAVKIAGKTAIPTGTYIVVLTHSQRFGRVLPLLVGVENYSGVRIHPGNTAEDTEGCLLPGRVRKIDYVGESKVAFAAVLEKLGSAKDTITITVQGETNA